jgi:hypothetical protein
VQLQSQSAGVVGGGVGAGGGACGNTLPCPLLRTPGSALGRERSTTSHFPSRMLPAYEQPPTICSTICCQNGVSQRHSPLCHTGGLIQQRRQARRESDCGLCICSIRITHSRKSTHIALKVESCAAVPWLGPPGNNEWEQRTTAHQIASPMELRTALCFSPAAPGMQQPL